MKIDLTRLTSPAVPTLPLEIVERKGIGHPDTICDALVETLSKTLSRCYVERFGVVLHHNVDKALLCGGAARPAFGGGEVTAPIEIHLGGRATCEFQGVKIAVDEIAIESSRDWLRKHLRHLDPLHHVRIFSRIRPTSSDLASLFGRRQGSRSLANDTSFGVGFARLDMLERAVLAVESALNAPQTKADFPEIGEDVKVMGARQGAAMALTVACAFVDRHITDLKDYRSKKERVTTLALEAARTVTDAPLTVKVNSADHDTSDSVYLTVTGLSAESGDDGQVGRGNRVNGLITPYRPMSLEAAAGKNPVTHVGKLYNVIASRIANAVVRQFPQITEAYCYLLSRIGQPIVEPQLFELALRFDAEKLDTRQEQDIREVARMEFMRVDSLWQEAIAGTLQLW